MCNIAQVLVNSVLLRTLCYAPACFLVLILILYCFNFSLRWDDHHQHSFLDLNVLVLSFVSIIFCSAVSCDWQPGWAQAQNSRDPAYDCCLQGTVGVWPYPLGPGLLLQLQPPTVPCRGVATSHVGQHPKLLVFCLDSTPATFTYSQVGLVHYKRDCFAPSSLILAHSPPRSPFTPHPPNVVMAVLYYSLFTTFLAPLPILWQCLKTTDCLFSLGSTVLGQWRRSSSKELRLISRRRPFSASCHGACQTSQDTLVPTGTAGALSFGPFPFGPGLKLALVPPQFSALLRHLAASAVLKSENLKAWGPQSQLFCSTQGVSGAQESELNSSSPSGP
jgi:hypothetical protein